ncbi:glutamate receptor ionotropic, kainate 2-like [Coccinella septempunctata]|uniref:glutamate receptor ionotropic, kainate 2-like n=1 Tax=Coccinella septempunctata TaxID=41139 RepID=UPI001D096093|nr:glutamate receptor ionotropic, kainate 2-like [Coccinella septempunctata]
MKYVIVIVLICIEKYFCSEIVIGALFDKHKTIEDIYSTNALKYAVERVNNGTIDKSTKISYKIENIDENNPFQALKKTCELLSQGVVAILGPRNGKNFEAVQSVCDAKEIPVIQTTWNAKPLRDSTVINIFPHPTILSQAYLDFLRVWNWKRFTILYDNDESLIRLNEVLKLTLDRSYVIIVRKLDQYNTGIYRNILREMADNEMTNFFIDCRLDYLQELLQQCQQMGLMNKRYHYFINNIDTHILELVYLKYSQTNITTFRLVNNDQEAKDELCVTYYVDDVYSECFLRTSYFLIMDAVTMINNTLAEMKDVPNFATKSLSCDDMDNWEYGLTLINLMKTKPFEGITGLNVFDNEGYRSDFVLEVAELQETGMTTVGTWTASGGFNLARMGPNHSNADDNESLANKNFTVQLTLTKPFGFHTESPNTLFGNDRFEGFAVDLIKALAEMEHFNYTFVLREDNDNGSKDPISGQWSGMIGELINKTTDLAITDLTINSQRAEAVDFTTPFMNLGIAILFQKPKEAEPNFFSFADPFSYDTWVGLFLCFLLVSFSMFLLGRICPSEWTNPYPCIQEPEYLVNQFTLPNSFWFSMGCLMQQGSEIAPIATATRMVGTMWMFLILILIASYTANLAASLAKENPENMFTDVTSLVENAEIKKIRYGAKKKGATYNFFKNSKNPIYQKIFEHMRTHDDDMVKENADGVKLAMETQYAFFMENTAIDYEIQRHCNLAMYGDLLDNKGYGIAMRKHSPYRSKLSSAILKLQSTGVMDNLKRKWWQEKRGGGQCVDQDSSEATPLGMKNVEGVFIVTIEGLMIGLLIVLIEKIISIISISRRSKISIWRTFKHEMKCYVDFENSSKPVLRGEEEDPTGEGYEEMSK